MAHGADTPAPAAAAGPRELPVFILTGPTGAGKTDWALGLAETAQVEIVSVDSALVYRGLDIGTAKPARELRARVPHHLIDLCEPTESYSAGRFVADALGSIRDIHARGRVPLLVGGTMLYLRALLRGLAALPQADPLLRSQLDARAAKHGWPALHAELAGRSHSCSVRPPVRSQAGHCATGSLPPGSEPCCTSVSPGALTP